MMDPASKTRALEATVPGSLERWHLILAYRGVMLQVARRRLSPADAEDCVHDVLVRAALHQDLESARAEGFLRSATTREAIDRLRRYASNRRMIGRLPCEGLEAGPEEQVCDVGLARWIAELAVDLGVRERQVLAARVEGLTLAEASERLGITAVAAESAYRRAVQRLRQWAA